MGRCRVRQRRLHRTGRRKVRTSRGSRDRPVRGAAQVRAGTTWDAHGRVPPRRRYGASLSGQPFYLAVMALAIFFVPDPAKGVAEMVRVVSPGGTVAAYAWDMAGGGFPLQPVQAELLAMGFAPVRPPRSDASKIDALQNLWTEAGLDSVETRKIEVQRRFADFEDFWATAMLGSTIGPTVATMVASDRDQLKTRVRARLPAKSRATSTP